MTDIFDQATDLEELQRQQALDRQRAKGAGPDRRYSHCMDCGCPIDPARLAAVRNCHRCIDCEQIAEARGKLFTR